MKQFLKRQDGFTLLEMAAVLLIISLLLLVLIPTMTSGKDQAKGVSCEANIRVIRSEVNLYYAKENKREGDRFIETLTYQRVQPIYGTRKKSYCTQSAHSVENSGVFVRVHVVKQVPCAVTHLVRNMEIMLDRRRETPMPEQVLDAGERESLLDQERRVRVAERMERNHR